MAKGNQISKVTMTAKVSLKTENHINKMVRKFSSTDKRFETTSAAIRYYIELGIAAESDSVETGAEFMNKIFLRDGKHVVAEQLTPIVNAVNSLSEAVEILYENQANYFTNAEQKFADFESRTERQTTRDEEQLGTELKSFIEQLSVTDKMSDAAVRNLVILRIAFHLFVLEVKAGQIQPGRQSSAEWIHVIARVQERVRFVPIDDIKTLSEYTLEIDVIRKGASAIFAGDPLPPELNYE